MYSKKCHTSKFKSQKEPLFKAGGLKVHQKGIDVKYDCDIIALESCKSQSFVKDHANRPFLAHQGFWHTGRVSSHAI